MARLIVFDEWLLHDLRGDNGVRAQREAVSILTRIRERQDRIVVVRGSAWVRKLAQLARIPDLNEISKLAWTLVLDSRCCLLVDPNDLTVLPDEIIESVDPEDRYLVQAYVTTQADLLITTDSKLAHALGSLERVHVSLREGFVKEYLSQGQSREHHET